MIPRRGSPSQRPRLHTRGSFRPPLSLPEEPTIESSSSSEQLTRSLSSSQWPLPPRPEQPTRSFSLPPRQTEQPMRSFSLPPRQTEQPMRSFSLSPRQTEQPMRSSSLPPLRQTEQPMRSSSLPPLRQTEQPMRSSSLPPLRQTETPITDDESVHTQDPCLSTKQKNTRGPTRNLDLLALKPGEKLNVEWDTKNRPVAYANKLASRCGRIVKSRCNAPIQVNNWDQVPKEKKDKMLSLVKEHFELNSTPERDDFILQSMGKKFREHRGELRKKYYYSCDSNVERRANPPPNMTTQEWAWLIRYWGSDEFKKLCKVNTANRSKQEFGHCSGSKSFAVRGHEEEQRTGQAPTRLQLFEITRKRKNETPMAPKAGELLVQLHAAKARLVEASCADEETIDEESIDEEAWKEVMPPDRPGRVLGMGAGVTPTQFRGGRKDKEDALLDKEIKVLRDQLSAANVKIEKMEVAVRDVGKIKKMEATIAKGEAFMDRCSQYGMAPPGFPPFDDEGDGDGLGCC